MNVICLTVGLKSRTIVLNAALSRLSLVGKNWLFANTPRGARASAVIYSIIETAKENGLNPYDYLTYIIERAPNVNMQNPALLDTLMPHQFIITASA